MLYCTIGPNTSRDCDSNCPACLPAPPTLAGEISYLTADGETSPYVDCIARSVPYAISTTGHMQLYIHFQWARVYILYLF